jgi:hypothetical protein
MKRAYFLLGVSLVLILISAFLFMVEKDREFSANPEYYIIEENNRVKKGKNRAKNISIAFVGIIRDVGPYLDNVLKNAEETEKYFKEVSYFLYENDSKDNTVEILKNWKASKKNFDYVSEKMNEKLPISFGAHALKRFVKMATLRNKYINWIRSLPKKPDYIVVVDWDLRVGFDVNGFLANFAHDDWDAVGANGVDKAYPFSWYYDPLAYQDIDNKRVRGHSVRPYPEYCDYPDFDPTIAKMIPVKSTFGGMVIYKTPLFLEHDYGPEDPLDCEHIMFHRKFKNRKFFLNSEFILFH